MSRFLAITVGFATIAASSMFGATIIIYDNLAAFQAVTNTTIQATYDSFPGATGLPSPLVDGLVVVTILPGAGVLQVQRPGEGGIPPHSSNVLTQNGIEDFDLTFLGPAPTAVGFDTYTNNQGPPIVTIFDTSNVLLASLSLTQPPFTVGFLGITSSVPIGRVHWLGSTGVQLIDTGIDTVRLGSLSTGVPEPSAFALIGSSLAIIIAVRRRNSHHRC